MAKKVELKPSAVFFKKKDYRRGDIYDWLIIRRPQSHLTDPLVPVDDYTVPVEICLRLGEKKVANVTLYHQVMTDVIVYGYHKVTPYLNGDIHASTYVVDESGHFHFYILKEEAEECFTPAQIEKFLRIGKKEWKKFVDCQGDKAYYKPVIDPDFEAMLNNIPSVRDYIE